MVNLCSPIRCLVWGTLFNLKFNDGLLSNPALSFYWLFDKCRPSIVQLMRVTVVNVHCCSHNLPPTLSLQLSSNSCYVSMSLTHTQVVNCNSLTLLEREGHVRTWGNLLLSRVGQWDIDGSLCQTWLCEREDRETFGRVSSGNIAPLSVQIRHVRENGANRAQTLLLSQPLVSCYLSVCPFSSSLSRADIRGFKTD